MCHILLRMSMAFCHCGLIDKLTLLFHQSSHEFDAPVGPLPPSPFPETGARGAHLTRDGAQPNSFHNEASCIIFLLGQAVALRSGEGIRRTWNGRTCTTCALSAQCQFVGCFSLDGWGTDALHELPFGKRELRPANGSYEPANGSYEPTRAAGRVSTGGSAIAGKA